MVRSTSDTNGDSENELFNDGLALKLLTTTAVASHAVVFRGFVLLPPTVCGEKVIRVP